MKKKLATTGIVISISTLMIISTGCTRKANDQVKQQGVNMQQSHHITPLATPAADNRIQVAKQATDQIVKINGVKSANALVTGKSAYVAAVIDANQGQLSSDMEHQIAQQVRATDPNIQNVYVSTNPEFVDRVNRYVSDVRLGHPVSGFFQEFTQIVQRVFPKAR
ncbi:YhcN/YlaJ family sporulation lipoprotein [Paenibacillus aceris]|uniref:YhcN/YlaJ family sporulation lipoprotein n=1 Tax=Paenibacillus aceris TaxID=869555 RepID=A0ABS4I042_9BACL|nr:YhcN/YlaJ family sporulation lipoprotein [Paenibacillus aceris]MBP1964288.1 YhcN/YlaJ family sporulation lipoprotein [Paenibacillus aceris]NHW36609.1 YhcN/YlaJ family sporulation lipoprotein [Paenibacillus aceris]